MEKKEVKEKKDKKEKINKKEIELNKKIEELTNQVNELTDKNMRVQAEMINSLRRKDEENSRILRYKNEDILKELLIVCDNFERALLNEKKDNNYSKGIEMIYNSIKKILLDNEVKEIDSLNKEFDPTFHQAVMEEEKEGFDSNIVIEVMQKGYTYKDKVIRPAMVKVSK